MCIRDSLKITPYNKRPKPDAAAITEPISIARLGSSFKISRLKVGSQVEIPCSTRTYKNAPSRKNTVSYTHLDVYKRQMQTQ